MAGRLLSALAALILVFNIFPLLYASAQGADTASRLQGGICVYKAGSDIQGWIDGELTQKAGLGGEWYIMTLAQSGGSYDFSGYERALLKYLKENKIASATSREKYALTLISIGSEDSYILEALENSAGQQGLMSLIFGLHIVNNGCTAGDITADKLIGDILALQLNDGGFAIIGANGDPDCTAMTLTALAPYYGKMSKVKTACDKAISFLSGIQQASGAYRSFGKDNCESTAQALLALSSLGIDADSDSRFIKGDNSLLDGLAQFALPDGSFEHARGEGANESATTQAFYSLAAYERMAKGKSPFFIFDKARPQSAKLRQSDTPKVTTKAVTTKREVTTTKATQGTTSEKASTAPLASGGVSADGTAKSSSNSSQGSSSKRTTTTRKSVSKSETASQSVTETSSGASVSESVTSLTAQTGEGGLTVAETASSTTEQTSAQTSEAVSKAQNDSERSIKLYIYIGIGSAAVIGCVILLVLGKRNIKSFVFIIVVGGALCAVTAFLQIETKQEHFDADSIAESESIGKAQMSIDCLTIIGEGDNIPKDGYILKEQSFEIKEGETAFDLLLRIAKQNGIVLDIKGSDDYIYVSGIAGIYEYEYGELSGWMYYVNGKAPSVNSSQYVLKEGDSVEWRYTREIGHDLDGEDEYYENS